MKNIKIKNKYIGSKYPPFIIAEISANHKKSLNRIYKIINGTPKTNWEEIPLSRKLDTKDLEIKIIDKKNIHLSNYNPKILSLPWEWHDKISKFCTKKKIIFFSITI